MRGGEVQRDRQAAQDIENQRQIHGHTYRQSKIVPDKTSYRE